MTEPEAVERVARAIYETAPIWTSANRPLTWEELTHVYAGHKQSCRIKARAALAAAPGRNDVVEECATVADGMRDLMALAMQRVTLTAPGPLSAEHHEKYECARDAAKDIADGIRSLKLPKPERTGE